MKDSIIVSFILICVILIGVLFCTLVWALLYTAFHKKGRKYILRIRRYQNGKKDYIQVERTNYFSSVSYYYVSELKNLGPAILDVISYIFMQI